jgi:hypothetical protein
MQLSLLLHARLTLVTTALDLRHSVAADRLQRGEIDTAYDLYMYTHVLALTQFEGASFETIFVSVSVTDKALQGLIVPKRNRARCFAKRDVTSLTNAFAAVQDERRLAEASGLSVLGAAHEVLSTSHVLAYQVGSSLLACARSRAVGGLVQISNLRTKIDHT